MKKPLICYDMDGVLLDILRPSCDAACMYDLNKIDNYNIAKCSSLTPKQQQSILREFSNPDIFKRAFWYDGAEDLRRLERDSLARVCVYSLCFGTDIQTIKKDRLMNELHISDKNIELVVAVQRRNSYGPRKPHYYGCDVIVEDCVENLQQYPANVIKVLIDRPYNRVGREKVTGCLKVATDLREANAIVERAAKYLIRKSYARQMEYTPSDYRVADRVFAVSV